MNVALVVVNVFHDVVNDAGDVVVVNVSIFDVTFALFDVVNVALAVEYCSCCC